MKPYHRTQRVDQSHVDRPVQGRERELKHFLLLDRAEQEAAIHRLAAAGLGDYSIATATSLSVEMVRRVLAQNLAAAQERGP